MHPLYLEYKRRVIALHSMQLHNNTYLTFLDEADKCIVAICSYCNIAMTNNAKVIQLLLVELKVEQVTWRSASVNKDKYGFSMFIVNKLLFCQTCYLKYCNTGFHSTVYNLKYQLVTDTLSRVLQEVFSQLPFPILKLNYNSTRNQFCLTVPSTGHMHTPQSPSKIPKEQPHILQCTEHPSINIPR